MDEIEEIKRKIDIVEFISGYLTLKKAGANYRAMCPFHSEKTPSMMISPEKQIFKCFGCSEGGDIFSFVMKMENLEFREALEMLAERAGVKLEKYRQNPKFQEEKDQKTRLFQINNWAARLFHEILLKHPTGKPALQYLQGRGLNIETIKTFQIGYAPSSNILKQFLHQKSYSDHEIQSAGGPDRFYKRIIFPIRDVMGNAIGFTGRVMDAEVQPKYLNTPETIIFHKGRILYNLDKARGEIKLAKTTVVVEGQMDVISSYQAGVKNVVATSGTALTDEHLKILYRYTPNIVFSFDSDNAGLTTAKKAYEMAIQEGMNARMVNLGEFKDPGEMVAKDASLWIEAVEHSQPVIDWYFDLAFRQDTKNKIQDTNEELTPVQKKEIAKELIPVIRKIPDEIERAHYVGVLARKLNVVEQVVFDILDKKVDKIQDPRYKIQAERSDQKPLSNEELLVGLLSLKPDHLEKIKGQVTSDDFEEAWSKELYTHLLNWYNEDNQVKIFDKIKKELSGEVSGKFELILLEIEETYTEPEQVIIDLVSRLKEKKQEKIKQYYATAIAAAEEAGDREKLKELVKEFQNVISK